MIARRFWVTSLARKPAQPREGFSMKDMKVLLVSVAILSVCFLSTGCKKAATVDQTMQPAPQTPEDMNIGMDTGPVPPGPSMPPPVAAYNDASGAGTYTVQKGDGLMSIARVQLGNASRWKEIATLNPEIAAPGYAIRVGQVIKLPAK